jgi:hypothetical protein
MSSQVDVPTQREAELLRGLRLDHIRVDLHLNDPSYCAELERAVRAAQAIGNHTQGRSGTGLELALFLSRNAEEELTQLISLMQEVGPLVRRVLVLEEAEGFSTFRTMTPAPLVRLTRERLESALPAGVPFASGTDQFFTELNRDWSQVEAADAIVYSLNPQVHASDDSSVMENLQGQVDTVRSTQHFAGNKPVFVSPVTFIGRTGPFPSGPPEPGGLPGQVDVRQTSLFGAAWTLGAIKQLSEADVGSITFYEIIGWRGILESEAGSPMPDRFPSSPGAVFPMYHVLAEVGAWKDGELLEARSNDPLAVTALALRTGERMVVLVANLTPRPQTVQVGPLEGDAVRLRRLDEQTIAEAGSQPERFRQSYETSSTSDGRLKLELLPYAVVTMTTGEDR